MQSLTLERDPASEPCRATRFRPDPAREHHVTPTASRKDSPTLFVTATAHLDTQWRWTCQDTVLRYLPETLRRNFALFAEYPSYRFSFEGAYRYMLVEEYHSGLFAELREWIAEGRWNLTGSAIEAGDVNTVSPESLVRQFLYGNGYFREKFGKESRDVFLPDCFGFGWALPSVAAHCGLVGFSTSKLEWGSSVGIPFNLGFWEGVDGNGLVAAINPGQYSLGFEGNLARDRKWAARLRRDGKKCGVYTDLKYFGTGDTGGAPDEASVRSLEESAATSGSLRVVSAPPDGLFAALSPREIGRLPRHRGEFLLIEHGTGTYTAHGAMKRWNRWNEQLAFAAEAAALIADWLGAAPYPEEVLRQAWLRVLANQMHDILPGTSIPEVYRFAWGEEAASLNQFAGVLERSVAAVSSGMTRSGPGQPLVLFNSLPRERDTLVRARIPRSEEEPLRVDGRPVQVLAGDGAELEVLFPARVPPLGFRSISLTEGEEEPQEGGLKVSGHVLENALLRAELDSNGDLSRLYDKRRGREVLSAPMRLEMLAHAPAEWPAWTIPWDTVSRQPRETAGGGAQFRIVENGPWRAAVEVVRTLAGSTFRLVYRLSEAPWGDRLEVAASIRWETPGTVLKVAFPLAAENKQAVYDLGLGTITRGTNHPKLHEVPAQRWAALLDRKSGAGAAILSDCKYGWDKPDGRTLRLTLIHTPGPAGFTCHLGGAEYVDDFAEQFELDYGNHEMSWAIRPVASPGELADVELAAEAWDQPVYPFLAPAGEGPLGEQFSFMKALGRRVGLMALKREETGRRAVVRVRSLDGEKGVRVRLSPAAGVSKAEELRGDEQPLARLRAGKSGVGFEIPPYSLRTVALTLSPPKQRLSPIDAEPIVLPWNMRGISTNENRLDGDFDGRGHSIPSELLPADFRAGGVLFRTGPRGYRERNVLACEGQTLDTGAGKWDAIVFLAASIDEKTALVEFFLREQRVPLAVPSWSRPVGQWDNRIKEGRYVRTVAEMDPGYTELTPLGWFGTHRHSRNTNADEPCISCHLHLLTVPLKRRDKRIALPADPRVRIVAASLARGPALGIRFAGSPLGRV